MLRWTSGYPGGSTQTFGVQVKLASAPFWPVVEQLAGVQDPGFNEPVTVEMTALLSNTEYMFRVRATNGNAAASRNSDYTAPVTARTKGGVHGCQH